MDGKNSSPGSTINHGIHSVDQLEPQSIPECNSLLYLLNNIS